jgi:hypothetical protein
LGSSSILPARRDKAFEVAMLGYTKND